MSLKNRIENYQPQMIRTLEELVRFESVRSEAKPGAPYGEENARCLKRALEIVQKLLGVYRSVTGDHSPAYCIGGGTYAKDIPNILAFGAEKQGAEHHIHGADEYIGLEQMVECAYIYAEAMKALAE